MNDPMVMIAGGAALATFFYLLGTWLGEWTFPTAILLVMIACWRLARVGP